MKKLLGVAVFGSLLLAVFLVVQGRAKNPAPGDAPAPSIAAATAPPPPPAPAPALTAPPLTDNAACSRLDDLCSTADHKVDLADCEKQLADARKLSGAPNVERSERCMADAQTCAAASGCLSGGVGMGALGEFFKGLGNAMSK